MGASGWDNLLIDLQVLRPLWDHLERVHEHVPRERDVEVAEPQKLSPMAEHGGLKRKEECLRDNTKRSSVYSRCKSYFDLSKHVCPLRVDVSCQQAVCLEAYLGLPVALWAYNAVEARGQQPAEGKLQEGDVLPEEADSHQGQQTAVWQ